MLSSGGRSCPMELAGSQWGQGPWCRPVQLVWQVWVWCEEATGLGELCHGDMV